MNKFLLVQFKGRKSRLFLFSCFFFLFIIACSGRDDFADRPNFLFILVDDLGINDLSVYGAKNWQTPHIDRLAKEGILFKNAYAASSICSPVRASLLTGKHPSRLGVTDWIPGEKQPNDRVLAYQPTKQFLSLKELTIAEALKKKGGYQTAHIGKWHLGGKKHHPKKQGFDHVVAGSTWGRPKKGYFSPYEMGGLKNGPKGEYLTHRITKETQEILKKFSKQKKPFFMHLSYYTVHGPFQAPKNLVNKYKQNPEIKNPAFAAMVESFDESVGSVLKTLEDLQLDKNTIVFLYSDNGGTLRAYDLSRKKNLGKEEYLKRRNRLRHPPYRGSKGDLYEGGIRVPLIVKVPNNIELKNRISKQVITTPDFYPTMLELANLSLIPEQHPDGISFIKILKDPSFSFENRRLYWDFPHFRESSLTFGAGAVREGRYKLIEFYETGKLELYDLKNDEGENNNLVKEMPKKAADMKQVLHNWRKSVGASEIKKILILNCN